MMEFWKFPIGKDANAGVMEQIAAYTNQEDLSFAQFVDTVLDQAVVGYRTLVYVIDVTIGNQTQRLGWISHSHCLTLTSAR